ncbi:hypothetical protein [Melissospora conviva]|uniref:hypothetical protein n=1 Tax=Melissospora conviva TaxID=3388432 RepID=UPI003B776EE4
MTDRTQQPDRFEIDTPRVLPPTHVQVSGFSMDNINRAETPSGLAGMQAITEWDAASLGKAIEWLEDQANYLERMSYRMAEIDELMGGKTGKSSLGGFGMAQELAAKHAALFTSTQANLRTQANSLDNAAQALRKVKENYETAEAANEMTAAQMQQIFNGVATGDA